jgi:hypothetical protein
MDHRDQHTVWHDNRSDNPREVTVTAIACVIIIVVFCVLAVVL